MQRLGRCSLIEKKSSQYKQKFLDLYAKTILRATVLTSEATRAVFKPLLLAVEHDDFQNGLLPICNNVLRRNPEIVLECIGHLLITIDLDLSNYATELITSILDQALHSDEHRQADALSIIGTFSDKSNQPGALLCMFNAIKKNLEGHGTHGKLTVPRERVGMLNALNQLSKFSLDQISTSGLAPSICSFILSYKDDGSNDVKMAALSALTSWVSVLSEAVEPDIISFITEGLRGRDTFRKEHLKSIRIICKKSDSLTKVTPFLDHLIDLLSTGFSNKTEWLDGVYAISRLSTINAEADGSFAKEKLWRVIAQDEHLVISVHLLSKLSVDDCLTLVDLLQSLLVDHAKRLPSFFSVQSLLEVLIYLDCHERWAVRKMADDAINAVLSRSPAFAEDLLLLLTKLVSLVGEKISTLERNDVDISGDSQQQFIPSTNSLAKCLFLIAPYVDKHIPAQYRLILCSHHPCISSSAAGVWKWLQRRLKHEEVILTKNIYPNISVICKELLSQDGLFSFNKQEQLAALASLATLMTMSPNDTFTVFEKHLKELPDHDLHKKFSEDEIKIFFTPERQLYKQGIYNRLAMEHLMAEEASVREKVGHVQKNLALMLDALGELAIADPKFARDRLPCLAKYVQPLLSSPIVGYPAFRAMSRLARCTDPPLCNRAIDIAAAFRVISVEEHEVVLDHMPVIMEEDSRKRPSPGPFQQIVTGLTLACKNEPLPDLFTFIFPILEKILLSSKKTCLHDDVLQILSMHLDPILPLPRPRILSVLYHVLSIVPAYHSSVGPMLNELCLGLKCNDLAQILVGIYAKEVQVRFMCLTAIENVPRDLVLPVLEVSTSLLLAIHDSDKEVAGLAKKISDRLGLDIWAAYSGLFDALSYKNENVRAAAAQALAAVVNGNPEKTRDTLATLFGLYRGFCEDKSYYGRHGVALALQSVAAFVDSADADQHIRDILINVGTFLIDKHGKENANVFIRIFESYKNKSESDDLVREGVVDLTDALAKHLSKDDPAERIIQKLLAVPASTAGPTAVILPVTDESPEERLQMVLPFQRLPDYVRSVSEELFDVVMLEGNLGIGLQSKYFVSLGVSGTDIYHMVFDGLEYHHSRGECLGHYEPSDILYIPTMKCVRFSPAVKVLRWSVEYYRNNVRDAAPALELMRYSPTKVAAGASNIFESDPSSSKLPPYLGILVRKMKAISRDATDGLTPKWRSIYKCDLAGKTIAGRIAFMVLLDLHNDHLKLKSDLKSKVGNVMSEWTSEAATVPSLNATINFTFRDSNDELITVTYDGLSLLSLYACGRNQITHADKLNMSEVEAEAIFS